MVEFRVWKGPFAQTASILTERVLPCHLVSGTLPCSRSNTLQHVYTFLDLRGTGAVVACSPALKSTPVFSRSGSSSRWTFLCVWRADTSGGRENPGRFFGNNSNRRHRARREAPSHSRHTGSRVVNTFRFALICLHFAIHTTHIP